ncbi:hypothetical protein EG329_007979 [Mollisiaceae sp. DMI_Dod_QoI]|nr:hypothetical protein EG329_007979 [Helotiales sp. DMI_Dod_QoI]
MRIINELPKTLVDTYQRFLSDVPEEYQPLATKLLHFLVGSSRSLTLEEMRVLIAIQGHHHTIAAVEGNAEPNMRATLEKALGPLVRIWDSRIYLVHQSLKDFLRNLSIHPENPLCATYGIDLGKASLLFAETCVSYLLLEDFQSDLFTSDQQSIKNSPISPAATSIEDIEDEAPFEQFWNLQGTGEDFLFKDPEVTESEACASITTKYPLFDYATKNWAAHFRAAFNFSQHDLQESVVRLSDCSNTQGMNWLRFYWHQMEPEISLPLNFSPLLTGSYFGHISTVELALSHDSTPDSHLGAHAIYWASRMGHLDVVNRLLQENINADVEVITGQTAFIAAVQLGHLEVVKRFLEDEGLISGTREYRVNHAVMGGRTPLSIASSRGFVEIVRQLLQHPRLQPDITGYDQWTPLYYAVDGNYMDIVQLLLTDNRTSINHVDREGRNILSWAAAAGHLEIAKYIISIKDLRADEPDHKGRAPFSWAAGQGHLETVKFLQHSCAISTKVDGQRIDISRKDNFGRNALSWACERGHRKVVEYLIKHDPKGVDEADVDGWTPLAWALFCQAPTTVQALLDSGLVDVNKKDRGGKCALSWAVDYGYLDVVKILLSVEGIDIQSTDRNGWTPMRYATSSHPHPDIIQVLQEASR